ncbi:hypothetical protein AMELA_G00257250 [Ameiurus melas]|uniref:CCHC-type domain-containing protein n=1 Tax=Ameiurus melas TaxID=219545 RepID=A0A7J5ZTR7_AMEME|nr:hypothetical protein AMELA_G00257250 [Ameiurus melas]
MLEQLTQYKPKNLAEDMILCPELRGKGSKVADKRLAKEKKGTYTQTGTPADCSNWWREFKEGKKKKKMATVVMAPHYIHVVKELDRSQGNVFQLKAQTKSQEEEIQLLNRKLVRLEEENVRLNCDEMTKNSSDVLQLESETDAQKEEIAFLKPRVQYQEAENGRLKDEIAEYSTSCDASKNSSLLPAPVACSASWQQSLLSLLEELPDVRYDNDEFWAKIKSWLLKEAMDPQYFFTLVKRKCPLKAWQAIEENFDDEDLTDTALSDSAMIRRLLEKLYKCVSEARGPGTNLFEQYYYRRQDVGETFEEYFKEKFRLYCSCRVQCENCGRSGHSKAQCRRPGGDAEVGPDPGIPGSLGPGNAGLMLAR